MTIKDIPAATLVAVQAPFLEDGYCTGTVVHRQSKRGFYTYSVVRVSSTCKIQIPPTTPIEEWEPKDEIKYTIILG